MRYFLIIILLLSACSNLNDTLTANDAWARPAFKGENGAVYFVIKNRTDLDEKILSASTDISSNAEPHMTMESSQGVMSMTMQEAIEISAGDDLKFEPGGLHIMLVHLNRDLKVGDIFTLILNFENIGEIQLQVEVKE